jgi:hypothetical protein
MCCDLMFVFALTVCVRVRPDLLGAKRGEIREYPSSKASALDLLRAKREEKILR